MEMTQHISGVTVIKSVNVLSKYWHFSLYRLALMMLMIDHRLIVELDCVVNLF